MTLECEKTNLKRGSKGEQVRELQTILKNKGYYNGRIDGDYGELTVEAVKKFQKTQKGLLIDGVFGPVTCKKLNNSSNGIYTNNTLCERSGGNCLGQITAYHCAPHSIKQGLRKFGITGYSEKTIGGYAGTTSMGTGHYGIETAIAKIARLEGINLKVEWLNFSDLGATTKERYKRLGEILCSGDKFCFIHLLYRQKYGHYEHVKQVNLNNMMLVVSNSLGSRCSYPAYCGYNENRTASVETSYIRGISQKSICIVTRK